MKGICSRSHQSQHGHTGSFLTPVEKDSMLLIDGGVVNNYPVDLARQMGADIVIGVIIPPMRRQSKRTGNIAEIAEHLQTS